MNDTTLAHSSNKLGFDLWDTIKSSHDGNLAFSPVSIFTALITTWAGARGDTHAEMAKVLNIDPNSKSALAEFLVLTSGMLYDAKFSGIDLSLANQLFGEINSTFNENFLNDFREIHGTTLEKLDFENNAEGARTIINNWVAGKTNNRIKELLPSGGVNSDTRLILANALYFMANWKAEFEENDTLKFLFKSNGQSYNCNMMYRSGQYRYAKWSDVSVIELPYVGNSISMYVVLPTDTDGLKQVEKNFSNGQLILWRRQLRSQEVTVRFPRFTIDSSSIRLSSPLRQLGMKHAFIPAVADFSGIMEEAVALSEVFHKTFIKVTEKGTEMAAATAVSVSRGFHIGPSFTADHPFAWFIVDNTSDLILGMGRVTEPKE